MKLRNIISIATIFVLSSAISLSNEIQTMKSETQRDREVEENLIKAYSLKRGEDIAFYYYNKVDLNGDNKPEVIVYAYGPMLAGSGGGSGLILKEISEGYQIISKLSLVRTPIIVSNNKTNGWKDIIMEVSGGGAMPSKVAMKFDGKKYPSNPSTQPKINAIAKIQGIKILADDPSINRGIKIE